MATELPTLTIKYEEVRSLVVHALRDSDDGLQFGGGIDSMVAQQAVTEGFVPDPAARSGTMTLQQYSLTRQDRARVQNILWDLIIEGVIRPGQGDGINNNLPHFHVTDYGRRVLSGEPPTPYDPDGYLRRLRDQIPSLDSIIETYLQESLHTLRIGCLLSSTVTLGCASEKALLLLIAAYADALPPARADKFRAATRGKMIKRQFEEFSKMLEGHLKRALPVDLKEDLDTTLSGIFATIRGYRNEAGHPTGKMVDREQAHAHLVIFPTYLRRVYGIIEWLRTNPFNEDDHPL